MEPVPTAKQLIRQAQKKTRAKRKSEKKKDDLQSTVGRGYNVYHTKKLELNSTDEAVPKKKRTVLASTSSTSFKHDTVIEEADIGHPSLSDVVYEARMTVGDSCVELRKEKTIVHARQEKEHSKKMNRKEDQWDGKRTGTRRQLICSITFSEKKCVDCRTLTKACVKCENCRTIMCWKCDEKLHSRLVLHDRKIFDGQRRIFLAQSEFINALKDIFEKGVCLQCFLPDDCPYCGEMHTLVITVGLRDVAVISSDGRFDLKSTAFLCENAECGIQFEARTEDYVSSGYWPGTADDKSFYLVCRNFLSLSYHLQHKSPGISYRAIIGVLSALSSWNQRCPSIDPTLVGLAAREFEYQMFRIDSDVKRINHMRCRACGDRPLFCHCDGNSKLYRFRTAGDHGAKALFAGVVFVPDKEIMDFVDRINQHIPEKHIPESCDHNFKAGKSNGRGNFHNMDQTGMMCMVCRHNIALRTGNMYRGETYRLVAFFHMTAHRLKVLFFCYDVVCRYWSFAKKVSDLGRLGKLKDELNGIISTMVSDMLPFLSRFHGQAHAWFCQVLWYGHFQKYAAASLGEEQEQKFAKLSLYCSTTRRMTPANREDHLSKGILYDNAEKSKKLVYTLVTRLSNARKKAPKHYQKLLELLESRKVTLSDLPGMAKNLVSQAKLVKARKLSSDWPLGNLQKELEGVSYVMTNIQKKEMKQAEGCIGRSPLRRKLTYLKKRSGELVKLINEKSGCILVTEAIRATGIFPWQTPGQSTVAQDLTLVDKWMLWKRFKEEEGQTMREMATFIEEVERDRRVLLQDVSDLTGNCIVQSDSFTLGQIALKLEEVDNLTCALADAVLYFDVHIEEELLEVLEHSPECKEEVPFSENLIDGLSDYESECDDDENECDGDESSECSDGSQCSTGVQLDFGSDGEKE